MKNNEAIVKDFFELMHQKRIAEWGELWDEDGFIFIPYPVAGFPEIVQGKATILEGFKTLFAGLNLSTIRS